MTKQEIRDELNQLPIELKNILEPLANFLDELESQQQAALEAAHQRILQSTQSSVFSELMSVLVWGVLGFAVLHWLGC